MFNLCEEIFAIENKAKEENLSVEELQKVREEKSKPVVEALRRWIDTEGGKGSNICKNPKGLFDTLFRRRQYKPNK